MAPDKLLSAIFNAKPPFDAAELDQCLYTAAMSYPVANDLEKDGDKKSPGTYFEILIGHLVAARYGINPIRQIVIPTLDERVTIPTDFIFELGKNRRIHLPIKISTRERVVQVWAHQKLLDGMHGSGRFKGPNLGINILDAVDLEELMSSLPWVTRRSSSGHLYSVLEPPMPRIHDEYLDCVNYLYPSETDAEDGKKMGGSGFLVGVPSQGLRQNFWFLYAVTNKHVIKNATVLRMNTRDGNKSIMPTVRSSWITHQAGDDIAACPISFDPKGYKFNHVPRKTFISKDIIKNFNIGLGDDTFMVGRFINHEGRQLNLPTVRFGNIAQMPWETIKQDDGFEQESFLIEARSIGGYSGSPIFTYIPAASQRPGLKDWDKPENVLSAHGPWLLGVDWGHINDWSPVCRENGEPVNPANPSAMQVRLNTGMTAAVPVWKLAELLDTGTLAEHRRKIEQEVREYEVKNPPVATMNYDTDG